MVKQIYFSFSFIILIQSEDGQFPHDHQILQILSDDIFIEKKKESLRESKKVSKRMFLVTDRLMDSELDGDSFSVSITTLVFQINGDHECKRTLYETVFR